MMRKWQTPIVFFFIDRSGLKIASMVLKDLVLKQWPLLIPMEPSANN